MPDWLDPDEPRDLYPAALILEDVAIRRSAPFGSETIDGLRAANERLKATAHDPAAAAEAHDDFHRRLVEPDGDGRLQAVHRGVRRELARYERAALACAGRVHRRAAGHDAIVSALERGDGAAAARKVRAHWVRALHELAADLDG
jgi:DNA-binding GntR family transcriptional regulator